ncbi:MAG: hypothetical protein KBA61_05265 [Spirochaetes bacterium]|nr:hypothetical protein [Spirochaetota bacterium]
MRTIWAFTLVAAILCVSSCGLQFREHFFLPGETVVDEGLTGTWDFLEPGQEKVDLDKEFMKLIFPRPSGGAMNCTLKRFQRKGGHVEDIPFAGKTFRHAGKSYLVAWDKAQAESSGKASRIEELPCIIFLFQLKGENLVIFELNKDKFGMLVAENKLDGHETGGNGYSPRTLHITSAGTKLRSVVSAFGIEKLVQTDKPLIFRREMAE